MSAHSDRSHQPLPEEFCPRHFAWRRQGGVGIITLDRPERKNPLTFESYAELRDLFRALRSTDAIKTIVLGGAGGNFCSGGNVHDIIGPLTRMDAEGLLGFTRMTGDLALAMRRCPQPIIAAVEGVCAGAGAILAMSAEFRLAAPSARTAFLFTRVGLAGCDMGACAILPRIIGQGRAAELLYTGRVMTAEEGVAWGFFNRVVDAPALPTDALTLATELSHGPTRAHAVTKQMLHDQWTLTLEAAIEAEAVAQAGCMQGQDFHRAYHAFVAKRRPVFEGN